MLCNEISHSLYIKRAIYGHVEMNAQMYLADGKVGKCARIPLCYLILYQNDRLGALNLFLLVKSKNYVH